MSKRRKQAEELVTLYNGLCPNAKRYTLPKDYLPPQILAALRMDRTRDQWISLFRAVQKSDKLAPPPGADEYATDLIWVLEPRNMAKIDAGQFDNPDE